MLLSDCFGRIQMLACCGVSNSTMVVVISVVFSSIHDWNAPALRAALSSRAQMDLVLSFFVGFYEPSRGFYVDNLYLIARFAIASLMKASSSSCDTLRNTLKTWGFPSQFFNQPRGLWPHYKSAAWGITPERVSNPEPPDSRPCILTTTLLGG
jgi:hypothetical protein